MVSRTEVVIFPNVRCLWIGRSYKAVFHCFVCSPKYTRHTIKALSIDIFRAENDSGPQEPLRVQMSRDECGDTGRRAFGVLPPYDHSRTTDGLHTEREPLVTTRAPLYLPGNRYHFQTPQAVVADTFTEYDEDTDAETDVPWSPFSCITTPLKPKVYPYGLTLYRFHTTSPRMIRRIVVHFAYVSTRSQPESATETASRVSADHYMFGIYAARSGSLVAVFDPTTIPPPQGPGCCTISRAVFMPAGPYYFAVGVYQEGDPCYAEYHNNTDDDNPTPASHHPNNADVRVGLYSHETYDLHAKALLGEHPGNSYQALTGLGKSRRRRDGAEVPVLPHTLDRADITYTPNCLQCIDEGPVSVPLLEFGN